MFFSPVCKINEKGSHENILKRKLLLFNNLQKACFRFQGQFEKKRLASKWANITWLYTSEIGAFNFSAFYLFEKSLNIDWKIPFFLIQTELKMFQNRKQCEKILKYPLRFTINDKFIKIRWFRNNYMSTD